MKKIENNNAVVAAAPAKVLRDRYGNIWIPPTEAELRQAEDDTKAFAGCGSWRFDFALKGGEILTPTGGKKK